MLGEMFAPYVMYVGNPQAEHFVDTLEGLFEGDKTSAENKTYEAPFSR